MDLSGTYSGGDDGSRTGNSLVDLGRDLRNNCRELSRGDGVSLSLLGDRFCLSKCQQNCIKASRIDSTDNWTKRSYCNVINVGLGGVVGRAGYGLDDHSRDLCDDG